VATDEDGGNRLEDCVLLDCFCTPFQVPDNEWSGRRESNPRFDYGGKQWRRMVDYAGVLRICAVGLLH
jgi:hypothetical protein